MKVREYSPKEIAEIHDLAMYTGEELNRHITLVAVRQKKPFECIKKRLEYEIKHGNIKKREMNSAGFTQKDVDRILEMRLCKSEKERKLKAKKLSEELGYTYSQIRGKFSRIDRQLRGVGEVLATRETYKEVKAPTAKSYNDFAVEIPLSSFNFEVVNGKLRYWPKF